MHRTPRRPDSSGSGRASPRPGSASGRSVGGGANNEDDDDFTAQLEELEALSRHLGLSVDEDAFRGSASADLRPATGGTSTSVSTTVPSGSIGGEDDGPSSLGSTAREGCNLTEDPLETLQGGPRAQYELSKMKLPLGCRIERSPGSSAQYFFTMDVAEGPYTPVTLDFWIKVFEEFPAPGSFSVRCTKRIFHPSVDPGTKQVEIREDGLEGGAAQRLQALLGEVRRLMVAPTDSPAINSEAAMLLQTDPEEFRRVVRLTLGGGVYSGVQFDRVLGSKTGSTAVADTVALEASAAVRQQRPASDAVIIDLMKLEVMRDQFKAQATVWQQANMREMADLEEELSR